jgi:hypothetical protein
MLTILGHKMQIKTTLRFHLTPVELLPTIKNATINKCWQGCREKGTLYSLLVEM